MVRGRGGMEEGEEEVVSSIPGGAGSPASSVIFISLHKLPVKYLVCKDFFFTI